MRRVLSLMSAFLFLAATAKAQVFPSFEAVMGQTRERILQTKAEQAQAKDLALAQDINQASREAGSLDMDTWQLRNKISDVRRRAQQAQNNSGQQGHDPFLRNEIQRLVWDLQEFNRRVDDLYRDIQRISRSIQQKDPELVQPARSLVSYTQRLNSDAGWIRSDANWAGMDIRRAGFSMEAWDVERESSDAENSARQAQYEAQRILGQVQ